MNDDPDRLTKEDVQILKQMVEQEKNYRWLRSTVRNAASWIAIVISAIALSWESLMDWFRNAP